MFLSKTPLTYRLVVVPLCVTVIYPHVLTAISIFPSMILFPTFPTITEPSRLLPSKAIRNDLFVVVFPLKKGVPQPV